MRERLRQTHDLADEARTERLAQALAPKLSSGQLVALSGPIGAGKSAFCRALIRARAGAVIDVPSPSFTIVQTYDLADIRIAHIDLYRLADPSELVELGIDDLASDHLLLVEWPERAEGALPKADLSLTFEILGEGRRVKLEDRCGILGGAGLADA